MTDEDVKIEITKHIMRCTKQHPVDITELTGLQNLKTPTNKDTKCLLACAYRAHTSVSQKLLIIN